MQRKERITSTNQIRNIVKQTLIFFLIQFSRAQSSSDSCLRRTHHYPPFPRHNGKELPVSLLHVDGSTELKRSIVLMFELLGLSHNCRGAGKTRRRRRRENNGLCFRRCSRINSWDRISLLFRLLQEHSIKETFSTGKNPPCYEFVLPPVVVHLLSKYSCFHTKN